MKTKDTAPPAPSTSDGGITLHNRLSPGHRYQAAIDEIFRVALRDLPGAWDVSVYSIGRAWFRIDVVAPDGASWCMSFPVHQGPRAEDLAETVRVACIRRSRLRPPAAKPGKAGDAADGVGGARSKLRQPRAEAAHPTSHDAAKGTPK